MLACKTESGTQWDELPLTSRALTWTKPKKLASQIVHNSCSLRYLHTYRIDGTAVLDGKRHILSTVTMLAQVRTHF